MSKHDLHSAPSALAAPLDVWSMEQSRQACVLRAAFRRVMKAAAERLSAASMLKKLNQGGIRWDHTHCALTTA